MSSIFISYSDSTYGRSGGQRGEDTESAL